MTTKEQLLAKLKEQLAQGNLTPTDKIEFGTFICLTQATPYGMAYHQSVFEQLPIKLAESLHGKMKGDKIGDLKIVAVFDIWPENTVKREAPRQEFNH
jgi:hypothetical protein